MSNRMQMEQMYMPPRKRRIEAFEDYQAGILNALFGLLENEFDSTENQTDIHCAKGSTYDAEFNAFNAFI